MIGAVIATVFMLALIFEGRATRTIVSHSNRQRARWLQADMAIHDLLYEVAFRNIIGWDGIADPDKDQIHAALGEANTALGAGRLYDAAHHANYALALLDPERYGAPYDHLTH